VVISIDLQIIIFRRRHFISIVPVCIFRILILNELSNDIGAIPICSMRYWRNWTRWFVMKTILLWMTFIILNPTSFNSWTQCFFDESSAWVAIVGEGGVVVADSRRIHGPTISASIISIIIFLDHRF
jgi:hypothetical protein